MHPDARTLLRHRGFSIYVDLHRFGMALRDRVPFAVARRRAEYVLIDGTRVPIGHDAADFERRHLHDVQVRDGIGYSHYGKGEPRRAQPPASPTQAPPTNPGRQPARMAVRHDRNPSSPHA